MARKIRPSSRTIVKFIAIDDEAIGVSEQDLAAAYTRYTETLDESHLQLRDDVDPCFYQARVLPFDLQTKLRDAITEDSAGLFSPAGRALLREFISRCLVAVTEHTVVTNIQPNGEFDTETFSWDGSDARPEGLDNALISDEILIANLFWFVFRASQLTETEKKP
jgi:hypothetical protein